MLTDQKIRSEDGFREHFLNNFIKDLNYEIEAHYNHYGDRGVIDTVTYERKTCRSLGVEPYRRAEEVYEFKYSLGDPKDVTKQFNRHKKFFLKGSEYRGKPDFYLVVYPSSKNWNKLQKFKSSYPKARFYFPELGFWLAESTIKTFKEDGVTQNWFDKASHVFQQLGISKEDLEIKEFKEDKEKKAKSTIDVELVKELTRQGCIVPKEAAESLTKEDVDRIKSLDSTPMYVSEAMLNSLRNQQEVAV